MSYPPSVYSNMPQSAGPQGIVYTRHKAKRSVSAPYPLNNTSSAGHNALRTPPRSPAQTSVGPLLLPKIRTQDQNIEDDRADDCANQENWWSKASFEAAGQYPFEPAVCTSRLSNIRQRSQTPPEFTNLPPHVITPDSADGRHLRIHSSSASTQSRSISGSTTSSSIDDATLKRYLYPSYGPVPSCSATNAAMANITASAYPSSLPSSNYSYGHSRPQSRHVSPAPQPKLSDGLAPEFNFDSYPSDVESTSLLSYLTSPNPNPSLVPAPQASNAVNKDSHFWWDVRNVRAWTSFNLDTIRATPGFSQFLDTIIPEPALPVPASSDVSPKSVEALHDIYASYFCTKINAGLKFLLGSNSLTMLANRPVRGARSQPNFITVDTNNSLMTQNGETRGRCVGIIKTYEEWDSGMRDGRSGSKQVKYLKELSHLHRCMREHQARYGFLMTEIELVCVRAGTEQTPYFGHLELAKPIPIKASGLESKSGLTACLALWYLNALCLNTPLQGQPPYELYVGPPIERTRSKIMKDKDVWLVKPHGKETRNARSVRGWIMPTDPINKKEMPKSRRKR